MLNIVESNELLSRLLSWHSRLYECSPVRDNRILPLNWLQPSTSIESSFWLHNFIGINSSYKLSPQYIDSHWSPRTAGLNENFFVKFWIISKNPGDLSAMQVWQDIRLYSPSPTNISLISDVAVQSRNWQKFEFLKFDLWIFLPPSNEALKTWDLFFCVWRL